MFMNFYRTLMNGSYGLVEIKLGGEKLISRPRHKQRLFPDYFAVGLG